MLHPFLFRRGCDMQYRMMLLIFPRPHNPPGYAHDGVIKIYTCLTKQAAFYTQINVDDGIQQPCRIDQNIFFSAVPHADDAGKNSNKLQRGSGFHAGNKLIDYFLKMQKVFSFKNTFYYLRNRTIIKKVMYQFQKVYLPGSMAEECFTQSKKESKDAKSDLKKMLCETLYTPFSAVSSIIFLSLAFFIHAINPFLASHKAAKKNTKENATPEASGKQQKFAGNKKGRTTRMHP
jgi:hypothetical protein